MSSRHNTVPLVALGIVAVAAVSWLLLHLSGGEAEPEPVELASTGGAAEVSEPPAPVGGPPGASPAVSPTERAEVGTEAESPSGSAAGEGARQWIHGRVELPAETPADEELFVLCLDRRAGPQLLYGESALADAAWDPEVEREGLRAVVPVEEDGSFRVSVSSSLRTAYLALAGRYLYSPGTTECELPTEERVVVLAGLLGAWITGVVVPVDPQSDLDGAAATLGVDIGGVLEPSRTQPYSFDSSGAIAKDRSFEFRGVSHEVGHVLVVRDDGHATFMLPGLRPEPGEHLSLVVHLRGGARLTGRVVDEAGAPVPDAEVGVELRGAVGDAAGSLSTARSGADGAFELGHVYLGRVVVTAAKEGLRRASLPLDAELVDGQELGGLTLVLGAGLGVGGTLRFPDGSGAAGAKVRISADLSAASTGIPGLGLDLRDGGGTTADAEGVFRVDGLGEGPFLVSSRVEVEEGERAGAWSASVAGVAGGREDLALVLEPLTTVRGRVTDLAGEPVESFRVMATLEGSGGVLGLGAESAQRSVEGSEDGTFSLDALLRPGSWSFEVTAESYAACKVEAVEVPGATEGQELAFVLEPAASVSGTVLDNFGTPIGGATVTRQVSLAEAIANHGREPVSTTSDARGRFHLVGLDPGGHALLARREGFAASEVVPVELVAGGVVEDVVLELRIGGLLTGEVFDDEGEPAPGRMVIVRSNDDPLDQRLLPTDASGEFRIEHLEPGGYQVIATVNFMTEDLEMGDSGGLGELLGSMKMTVADIVEGEETHVVLGAPPEDPVTLVGHVVHAGEPVPGVMVSLIPEQGRGMGEMKLRTADAEGVFTVELERRGPYLVTVQKVVGAGMQNSIEFRETIPAEGERHELVLELPVGRISGRIVGPDGKPVADCRVTLGVEGGVPLGSLLGGNYADIMSEATGRYDIPYLRPGAYSVSAGGVVLGGMLGEGTSLGRVVRTGLHVGEGEWLDDVDFELEEPGELVGRVFSLGGTAASGAAIFVRDEAGRLLERFSMVVTDAAGSFTYPGLAPGSYTFTAMRGQDVSAPSESIRVPSGGRGEGRVTLEGGTMLEIEVVEKSGEEVRARISVLDEDERELAGMLSLPEIQERFGEGFPQDALRVGPLSPGKYRVSAVLEDGRESYKRVTLSGDRETRKVVLRMK